MAEAILEREVCANCGVEVRPDTQFCYNCGKSVSAESSDGETKVDSADPGENESLADLERALAASRPVLDDSRSKLEAAAAERRRARVGHRKPLEIVWDRPGTELNWTYLLVVLLIFIFVVVTVLVTVFWK